jgi:ATP-dependent Clp protease ATP-binding subunit ClpX
MPNKNTEDHADAECSWPSDQRAPRPLRTPAQIVQRLDRFVIGQGRAKRALAAAVYGHYLSRAYAGLPGAAQSDFSGPRVVMLVGPTGSGKTYLIRQLCDVIGVDCMVASATSLCEVGYKGVSTDQLIESLLVLCQGDVRRAEQAIVCIDEIDKIRKPNILLGRDVSGEGVQNALLGLLDGLRVVVGGQHPGRATQTVDTSNILFLFSGAFSDLPEIVRARVESDSGFGFAARNRERVDSDDEGYAAATHDDLIQFGLIPELVGRLGSIVQLHHLSEDDLAVILTDAENSIIAKERSLFALHGVDLILADDTVRAVAISAARRGTGARGLVSIISEALSPVRWRLPDLNAEGFDRVLLTPDAVLRGGEPILLAKGATPPEWAAAIAASSPPPIMATADVAALAARALASGSEVRPTAEVEADRGITDVRGWPVHAILTKLADTKDEIGWAAASRHAKAWWNKLERTVRARISLALHLAEELRARNLSISQFFTVCRRSRCYGLRANLLYYEYQELRKGEEAREARRQAAKRQPPPAEG